jgi:hypothetical protein
MGSTRWTTVAVLACVIVIAAIAVALRFAYENSELAVKPIYAELQGIEESHRATKLFAPLYLRTDSDAGDVVGVPTDDSRFPNAWISISHAKGNGSVYAVMPSTAHVQVTCQQVDHLFKDGTPSNEVSPAVAKYFRQVCTAS